MGTSRSSAHADVYHANYINWLFLLLKHWFDAPKTGQVINVLMDYHNFESEIFKQFFLTHENVMQKVKERNGRKRRKTVACAVMGCASPFNLYETCKTTEQKLQLQK